MKTILVLFPNEWDRGEFQREHVCSRYRFIYEGFDLFRFPENVRLMTFRAHDFIERVVKKYRAVKLAGVISTDEQIGSLIACMVAQRLGLPGASLQALLISNHKYYSRQLQQRIEPQATPRFCVFPYTVSKPEQLALPFPMFVKPVKATFSILAQRVDSWRDLRRLLTFGRIEKLILEKLIQPFNDLATAHHAFELDAHHIIGEELLDGHQVTMDGFIDQGRITLLGIVDSIMYPGTNAFERFEYPSSLPLEVQRRMGDLATRLVSELGLHHGAFNVEFFYDSRRDRIHFIEINPRLAYQFADLYEKVDGYNTYQLVLDLAAGESPQIKRGQGSYRHAASFVLRDFNGTALKVHPSRQQLERLREQHHDARLMVYIKRGASLAREMKWLGSYRYAILNLGGRDRTDLHQRYHSLRSQLQFAFA